MEPSESSHEDEKIERLRRAMYSRTLSEKLGGRPRRELGQTQPLAGEDWQRPEPTLRHSTVAPRTIGLMRTGLWWVLGLSLVFFLGAAAFFGYYFTFGGGASQVAPANITIGIAGPPQIAGGEPTQLQVTVANRNQASLELADLVISYPAGTRSPTDLSTDLTSQRISLGTIEAGGVRQGTVSAVFAGATGDTADVKVELEYRLRGSSAIFVASSNYQATFSSSPISVSIDGNSETVSGQTVQFTATVSSNANTPIKDVLLSISYPFGFTFASGSPAPARPGVWVLGDFAPGQKRQVVIRGTLSGESGDERVFRFAVGTRNVPQHTGIDTPLSSNSFKMQVSQPFLGLAVSVNKSTGTSATVSPGDNVNVLISWQNNLSTPITDAVIVARLSGIQIDGAAVRSQDGFFRSSDDVVLWDKTTTNGALSNLSAGAHGVVSFSFQVPGSDVLKNIRNPSLTITINAAGKRLSEAGVPENLQATALQHIAVASDLTLAAQGLYYANPFVSVGPMPPKAGTETTYALVFTLTNTTNKISNAKLTAVLPPYVRWVGIYSPASEKVSFNQSDGTVSWNIGDIAPGVGLGGTPPRQAAIAIGFTPSTSQIGQEPVLLQNIVLTGTDASGAPVTRTAKDITSNIMGDPGFSATNATVVR